MEYDEFLESDKDYFNNKIRLKKRCPDTMIMIKYLILMIPLFIFAFTYKHIHAEEPHYQYEDSVVRDFRATDNEVFPTHQFWWNDDGETWKCPKCGQWQWSNYYDWKGDLFCGKCGSRKDE